LNPVPYITAPAIEAHLDWIAVSDALAVGLRGGVPEISDQFLYRGSDTLLSRAAWIDGQGAAVKSVMVMPKNPERGLPSVQGAMMLFEDRTGAVEAVIDSALVTKWKTAADSLLAARMLARAESERMVIVGAGAVAASLAEAYRAVFPKLRIGIWNRSPSRAEALAARLGASVVKDLGAAVRSSDIVACATMSAEPVLMGAWLRPGTHVDLVGAFTPKMREADNDVLKRGRLFVDCRETTVGHIGEIMIPMEAGLITARDILGDLPDMLAERTGRQSASEITVFKNGGGAHLDLLTGRYLLSVWRSLRH